MSLTGLLFLGLYFATLALCVFRHPIFGLYGYVLVFYLDPDSRWWGAGLPSVRWSFVLAVVTLVAIFLHRNRLTDKISPLQTPYVLLTVFVAWMWIQSPWVVDPAAHSEGLNFFTKYLIVVYLILALLTTVPRVIQFATVNVAGAFYLGYLAWQSGGGGRLDGIGGPGIDDANSLGMQMAVVVFLAGAVFLVGHRFGRWAIAVAAAFVLNAIILSGSRGAFLAFVSGALAMFLFRPARQFSRVAVFGLLGIVAFSYVASDFFLERMESIVDAANQTQEMDKSAASRLVIIYAQLGIAKKYPFGGGHKTTAALSDQYIPVEYHASQGGRSSHNSFMSALVDQGVPGFILWVSILISLIRKARYVREVANANNDLSMGWINAGVLAGVVVVSVAGLFAPYIRTEVYIWLLSLTCCLYGIARTVDRGARSPGHE